MGRPRSARTSASKRIKLTAKDRGPNTAKVAPVQFSFFRFKCMWVVPYDMGKKGNRSSTAPPSVTCMRKFSASDKSLEHLVDHHIERIKNANPHQPIRCQWKDCSVKGVEFKTIEDLIDHVEVHTQETVTSLSSIAPSTASDSPLSSLESPLLKHKSPAKTSAEVSMVKNSPNTEPSIVTSPSRVPQNKYGDVLINKEDKQLNLSWMSSVLHALMTTKVRQNNAGLCAVGPTSCYYCRFVSLKNRNLHKDLVFPSDLYEFTLFADKCQDGATVGDPLSFVTALYDSIANDEEFHHKSRNFVDAFWMTCLETDSPKCRTHPLKQNLMNLFPAFYKSCSRCSREAESWPTDAQENLIVKLRAAETGAACVNYPERLCVNGHVYQLSAVVSAKSSPTEGKSFCAYVKIKNTWICKNGTTSNMATTNQVFDSKEAYIVVYTAKHDNLEKENAWTEPEAVRRWYELGDCQKASEGDTEAPSVAVAKCITEPSSAKSRRQTSDASSKASSEDECSKKMSGKLGSAFLHRRIDNKGNESCIIAVLQALLQTTVAAASPEMCRSTRNCYFCNMLSFARRILSDRTGDPIPAYEFTLYKEDFDLTLKEGDPGVYISDLIGEIVNCERTNHHTSETKYKFMIMLQKKACSCMLSCNWYHWPVFPERRNECLLNLMMKYKTLCTQCNIMTDVQPVQMPDNLIVTIQENEKDPDASVHYPDEWASHNIRYNLAAVVTRGPTVSGKCHHYFAYCKVFGSWMCFDDDSVKTVSSTDVLGNKYACVLVYVVNELTVSELQSILADAQAYRFSDVHNALLGVKEEQRDW